MIYTVVTLEASEAANIGLLDQLVPPDQFDAALDAVCQSILRGSPFTLHHSKRMLRSAGHGETPVEDEQSLGWFVAAMQGADFAEGYAAFMGKRVPEFRKVG